jgi:DNA polymerase (family X)
VQDGAMGTGCRPPGVGEAIAGVIKRFHEIGTHPTLESMREEFPPGVLEMLSIPGLRPDRVLKLHKRSASARSPSLSRPHERTGSGA